MKRTREWVAGLWFLVGSAQAGTVALTVTGGVEFLTTLDAAIGWEFHVNSTTSADALGMFDFNGDGFTNPVVVGLWDIGGTLLDSTTVLSTDPLTSGFRFHPIVPVALTAGNDYVVAGLLVHPDYYISDPPTRTTVGAISFVDSRAVDTGVLTFPTGFTGQNGWFGANLTVTSVPEPASLALFGIALGALGWRKHTQTRA